MTLSEISAHEHSARVSAGLTQVPLAKMAVLSRTTVLYLEQGTLADLGVNKLENLLTIVDLPLGVQTRPAKSNVLEVAARTASTSYKPTLSPDTLRVILT